MDAENQLTAGGRFPHEDCGEACVLSVLGDAGKRVPMTAVEQACTSAGADLALGTTAAQLASVLSLFGIPSRSDKVFNVAALISAGQRTGADRWLVEIHSDAYGNPGGDLFHWVLTDGRVVMNPIGARLVSNVADYFDAATGDIVEVQLVIGGSMSPAGGSGAGLDPDDVHRAFSRIGWWSVGRSEPDLEGQAQHAGTPSCDLILAELRDTPEGLSWTAAQTWLHDNVGALQELGAEVSALRNELEELSAQVQALSTVNRSPRADVVVPPPPPMGAPPSAVPAPEASPPTPPLSEPASPADPSDHMETHPS